MKRTWPAWGWLRAPVALSALSLVHAGLSQQLLTSCPCPCARIFDSAIRRAPAPAPSAAVHNNL